MKWIEVEPDIKASPISEWMKGMSAIDMISLISRNASTPFVVFDSMVKAQILRHLRTRNVELGGLLLGTVISYDNLKNGVSVIAVTDAIASDKFESSSVSLRMDSSVWQKANAKTNNDFFVVGWYHSHPNLGAFFSDTDRKTQRNFFNQNFHLGLVIDPIRSEEKWFLGMDSMEIHCDYIFSSVADISRMR